MTAFVEGRAERSEVAVNKSAAEMQTVNSSSVVVGFSHPPRLYSKMHAWVFLFQTVWRLLVLYDTVQYYEVHVELYDTVQYYEVHVEGGFYIVVVIPPQIFLHWGNEFSLAGHQTDPSK